MKAININPLFIEINSEEAAVISSVLSALGVTAVVLLSSKEPNLLMDQEKLEWQWHSYVKVRDQLGRILGKMLAEKPQDHYQSAQEVLADVPMPQMELHIEIDQARLERQVAEIEEMDYFQQLQRQAAELRNSVETDPAPQLEAEVPQLSTLLGDTAGNLPSGAVNPEIQPEAATPPKLKPAFIDRCRQVLARRTRPMARHFLEETLTQHIDIFPAQVVEALGAEIPNPQPAVLFRQRLLL